MTEFQIIGLAGRAGSGKSLAARYLERCHGFRRMSFAAPLKGALAYMMSATVAELDERKADPLVPEVSDVTVRQAMQFLGTEWGRRLIGEDFWVAVMRRKLEALGGKQSIVRVAVDDVRFQNEVDLLTGLGGMVFRIDRPDADNTNVDRQHLSETQIDLLTGLSGVLDNSGTTLEFLEGLTCVLPIPYR